VILNFSSVIYLYTGDLLLRMRCNAGFAVSGIEARLECDYLLSRYLGTSKPANEFFALAAEHAAADYFDPAGVWRMYDIHEMALSRTSG
jgi:hypothetical protein